MVVCCLIKKVMAYLMLQVGKLCNRREKTRQGRQKNAI